MKNMKKLAQAGARKIGLWVMGLLGVSGSLIVLGLLLIFLLFIGIIAGGSSSDNSSDSFLGGEFGIGQLSPEVLAHKPTVEKYAAEFGMSAYVPILLAIMQQESGGRGPDPMQSSESYCGGKVGCIKDPDLSIKQGVIHFKSVLERAGGDVRLALQSYNFGGGFIDWVKANHGGKYSLEAAIQFSKEEYQRQVAKGNGGSFSCAIQGARELGACYGDYKYAERILKYVVVISEGTNFANVNYNLIDGNTTELRRNIAAVGTKYIGNSVYVFGGGRNQSDIDRGRLDCSSFVHWAYKQNGIDLGPLTSTSTETLNKIGRPISITEMKVGDIIFWNTYKRDGHVGIYIGNGQFIGAQSSTGVAIESLSNSYWQGVFSGHVRRIIED